MTIPCNCDLHEKNKKTNSQWHSAHKRELREYVNNKKARDRVFEKLPALALPSFLSAINQLLRCHIVIICCLHQCRKARRGGWIVLLLSLIMLWLTTATSTSGCCASYCCFLHSGPRSIFVKPWLYQRRNHRPCLLRFLVEVSNLTEISWGVFRS